MFLFFFLSILYFMKHHLHFLVFFRNGQCKAVSTTSRRPDSFFSHLFRVVTFCIVTEETKIPLTGATEGSAWFSLQAHHYIALRNNQTVHYHRDFTQAVTNILTNIGITLRLCDLHSCNVLSTLRSCLYCWD